MLEDHEVATLYTAADRPTTSIGLPGSAPFIRGVQPIARRWQIRQRHGGAGAAGVNARVLADLFGGVEAIELHEVAPADLAAVLQGVLLDVAPVSLAADASGDTAWALMGLWAEAGMADADCAGAFGIDPIGASGRLGTAAEAAIVSAAMVSVDRFPGVRSIGVDTSGWAEAGASPATELALSMATATEYLRALDGGGLAIDDAASELEFTYLATADQFVTMAKLRAARRLWFRVVEVCGGSVAAGAQHQRAITSSPTNDDPWVDVLRATTACFAAGVGGAQAVTVRPFDAADTDYTPEFADRIARNTHHLLLDESHVAEVVDPAGGAPFVEVLTETFAREAWQQFQSIESAGGMAAVAESNGIDELIVS